MLESHLPLGILLVSGASWELSTRTTGRGTWTHCFPWSRLLVCAVSLSLSVCLSCLTCVIWMNEWYDSAGKTRLPPPCSPPSLPACWAGDALTACRSLSSHKSRGFPQPPETKAPLVASIFYLLSLSTHTMLLPTNSQFYPEMKSQHFCQELHTETWFCFASGHTVFDKIRRKSPYQHFHTRETEKKKRKAKISYKTQDREDIRKWCLQVPNLEV